MRAATEAIFCLEAATEMVGEQTSFNLVRSFVLVKDVEEDAWSRRSRRPDARRPADTLLSKIWAAMAAKSGDAHIIDGAKGSDLTSWRKKIGSDARPSSGNSYDCC